MQLIDYVIGNLPGLVGDDGEVFAEVYAVDDAVNHKALHEKTQHAEKEGLDAKEENCCEHCGTAGA